MNETAQPKTSNICLAAKIMLTVAMLFPLLIFGSGCSPAVKPEPSELDGSVTVEPSEPTPEPSKSGGRVTPEEMNKLTKTGWLSRLFSRLKKTEPADALSDTLETIDRPEEEKATTSVGVFVDMTPSMKGFLSADGTETAYSVCLDELSACISRDIPSPGISYYRVDTPLWSTADNVLLQARKRDSYISSAHLQGCKKIEGYEREGTGYDSLCLTAALDYGIRQADDDLFILITDFYENNVNADVLLQKIREVSAPCDDGKVMGLVGVLCDFNGILYDQGRNGSSEEYRGVRPFYLILRGYPKFMLKFFGELCARMESECAEMEKRAGKPAFHLSVFYDGEGFYGLDYRAFLQHNMPFEPAPGRQYLKTAERGVQVTDAHGENAKELPLFTYAFNAAEKTLRGVPLVFSYRVDEARRQAFLDLAQRGEVVEADFPQKREDGGDVVKRKFIKLPYAPGLAGEQVWRWNGDAGGFDAVQDNDKRYFRLEGIYFDPPPEDSQESGIVYIYLTLYDSLEAGHIWKLHCEGVLKHEGALERWWNDWSCQPGESRTGGKTERLNDYAQALLNGMTSANQTFLSVNLYFKTED